MTTILKQLLKIYYEENIESFSLCLMVADTMQAGETRSVFPKAITVMTPGVIVERGHWRSLGGQRSNSAHTSRHGAHQPMK